MPPGLRNSTEVKPARADPSNSGSHQAAIGPGRRDHQRSRKRPDGMFEVLSACPAGGLDGIENQDIDIVTHRLAPVPVWGRVEDDFCASLFRALRSMKGRIRQKVSLEEQGVAAGN